MIPELTLFGHRLTSIPAVHNRAVFAEAVHRDLVELASALRVPSLVLLASDVGVKLGSDAGGSALNGPDRAGFLAALRDARDVVIDGGHCIHRSEPKLWLDEVAAFAKRAAGPG